MRQIVLDTETTGFNPKKGDKIVEVGCLEMVNRKLTGESFHVYINPERDIPEEVVKVHGITNDDVKDSPKFRDIADSLWQFLSGGELVIHNATFDMNFLNAEFEQVAREQNKPFAKLETVCGVLDTLKVAREKFPGSKVSLDALCKKFGIDNSHRTLHGALLDSEILADVYLMLTGGQTALILEDEDDNDNANAGIDLSVIGDVQGALVKVLPNADELAAHKVFLEMLAKKSGQEIQWPEAD